MINRVDWDIDGGIYRPLKGKRFATIRKKIGDIEDMLGDIMILAALGSNEQINKAKEVEEFCKKQIQPLVEEHGNHAGAIALLAYLYVQFNEERVVFAEVHDLFKQVQESLKADGKHSELERFMACEVHNMAHMIAYCGAHTKGGLFKLSKYNDDERKCSWPIKLPNNLNLDDLLNLGYVLGMMSSVKESNWEDSGVINIGRCYTVEAAYRIMTKANGKDPGRKFGKENKPLKRKKGKVK